MVLEGLTGWQAHDGGVHSSRQQTYGRTGKPRDHVFNSKQEVERVNWK